MQDHAISSADEREFEELIQASLSLDTNASVAAVYKTIGERVGAVGYDKQGRLVERQPDSSLHLLA